jgi:catechol 2,3-dioxygenase-like lactoylglutathione lyase family enzyme
MHRLALAVHDSDEAAKWFRRVFGAGTLGGSVVPFLPDTPSVMEDIRHLEGSDSRMLWHGGYPLLIMAPFGRNGYVANHLERWGPGIHSLAWEIEDMWGTDARLRAQGRAITGVNIPGRHFFLHPRDTHGVLIEFTDTFWKGDPRRGGPPTDEGGGIVEGASLAWVSAAVRDASATAELFAGIAGAREVTGNPRRSSSIEDALDVHIGDFDVRLVTPRTEESRYWAPLQRGPRLHSFTLRVPDLDAALRALEGEGVKIAGRDGDIAWLDQEASFGVPIELTA